MKNKKVLVVTALLLIPIFGMVILLGVSAVLADEEDKDGESIPWEQLPQAVRDAVQREVPGVQPTELKREVEDGFVTYEVAYESDGMGSGLKLTEDGQIIETEQAIAISDLPGAVLFSIMERFGSGRFDEAELVVLTFYEVKLEVGGKEREIKVFANGQPLDDGD